MLRAAEVRAGRATPLPRHGVAPAGAPQAVTPAAPANNESDVDPASYPSIDFTREMDASTLGSAITIEPSFPFSVRLDPADAKRALVAPGLLLNPSTT